MAWKFQMKPVNYMSKKRCPGHLIRATNDDLLILNNESFVSGNMEHMIYYAPYPSC